jgi:transcriptional regulator with PAS, ATPase and Fis domain
MKYENLEFKAIEKSKDLYFSSGSLRRYSLRPEIANSWIRYNLFRNKEINFSSKKNNKYKGIKLYMENVNKEIVKMNFEVYVVLDDEYIYDSIYKTNENFYSTGAEISNKIKKDYTVFMSEHISKIFTEKFTHGFIIKRNEKYYFTIGIQGDIKNYSVNTIKKIKDVIDNIDIVKKEIRNNSNFLNCKKIYNEINNFNIPLLLIGKKGVGKYHFVKYLHENYYAKYKLLVINCSRVDDIKKYFEVNSKTLIYLEKLECLTFRDQKELIKIMESKSVYKKQDKHNDTKDILLISSVKNDIGFLRNNDILNERLLSRLTINKYMFPTLKEYGNNVIIDMIECAVNKPISENAKLIISESSWKNNYYELKKIISFINEKSINEVIDIADLPKSIFQRNVNITTVKESEKELIIKTIVEYEKNITLCAKSLDISRSTLYRKINEYNISI